MNVLEILNYVKKFSGTRLLIKLGGSILNNHKHVQQLCTEISLLQASGITPIIVHGGGKAINAALNKQNLQSEFKNGLRVTNKAVMDTIETTLCGQVNQLLVRLINANGVCALGLSGCDGLLFECRPFSKEHGMVGDIIKINCTLIEHLLTNKHHDNIIPVIAPIGSDKKGNAFNINADWAASQLAIALNIHKLVYLTDQDGVLDQSGNLLSKLDSEELQQLIQNKIVTGGMLTKVNTILSALNHGLDHIHIINAKKPNALLNELFTDSGVGTLCIRKNNSLKKTNTAHSFSVIAKKGST